MIGILAYGSLITDPGTELEPFIFEKIPCTTPFCVEYARRSTSRANAPTLAIVPESIGAPVKGVVLLLKPDVDIQDSKNMLFRRELHRENDVTAIYIDQVQRKKKDALVIEVLADYCGCDEVYYTELEANFSKILDPNIPNEAKSNLLAHAAIDSVTSATFEAGLDGVQYLQDNVKAGIKTPLSRLYETAILELTDHASNLAEARLRISRQKGIIP